MFSHSNLIYDLLFFMKEDTMTVYIYVKEVKKDTVDINMNTDSFSIRFTTMYVFCFWMSFLITFPPPIYVGAVVVVVIVWSLDIQLPMQSVPYLH